MPVELVANSPTPGTKAPVTTLALTVTTAPTALTVEAWTFATAPPTSLSTAGQYHFVVDAEICVDVTGGPGTLRQIVRGAEGSTPATHALGAPVYHNLTAGALTNFVATTSGVVNTITAGDGTVTVGGSATAPTVKVTPGVFDASGVEQARAQTAEALLAPKANPTLTGTVTVPTVAAASDATTKAASTAFVQSAVVAGATGVATFAGRTGAVVPASGDYTPGMVGADAAGTDLQKSQNLADLPNVPTARTNLGLGSAATSSTAAFDAAGAAASEATRATASEALAAQRSANLSDLASAATARTNLGLGSAATSATGAFDAAGAATAATLTETTRALASEALAAQRSANLSDLASAASARTSLGLGSAATQPSAAFDAAGLAATETTRATAAEGLAAQKANNLSDLSSAVTARTNLGLGSAATSSSAAFDTAGAASSETTRATAAEALALQKASNLSDLPAVATARSNLGLGSAATQPSGAFDTAGAATAAAATETTRAQAAEALLAPQANPTLTGTVIVPTVSPTSDSTTKAASTAFVHSAVSASGGGTVTSVAAGDSTVTVGGTAAAPTVKVTAGTFDAAGAASTEATRATAAEALLAPQASPTLTGTVTVPTVSPVSDSTTKAASTAFVHSAVSASGGGTVTSVAAGDSTVTVGGTAAAPTVKVTAGTFDTVGAALQKTANLSDLPSLASTLANIGSTFVFGSGAPTTAGIVGQFYVDTVAGAIYGPKASATSTPNAWPSAGILDNTTRANESPLSDGGSWGAQLYSTDSSLALTSNAIVTTGGAQSSNVWTPLSGLTDCEVYCTLGPGFVDGTTNVPYLYWRVSNPGTSTLNCYYVKVGNGQFFPHKSVLGASSGFAVINVTLVAGDSIGVRMIGSAITYWHKTAAGSWTQIGSQTDTSLASGTVGILMGSGSGTTLTSIGGGAVVSTSSTPTWPATPLTSGGTTAASNVYVQSATPPASAQSLWFETDPTGTQVLDVLIGST